MANACCPSCDAPIQSARFPFCTQCAEAVRPQSDDERSETINDGTWQPPAYLFAERITPKRLSAWFSKGVNVDASQTGLLLQNGAFEGELPAGRHVLERLDQRIKKLITGESAAAVLLRLGVFPLVVTGSCADQSGSELTYSCEIGVRCEDPQRFYVELMQTQNQIVSGQLLQKLTPQFRHGVAAKTAQRSAAALLTPHPELTTRLTDELADELESTAARYGLVVSYISPLVFSEGKDAQQFRQKRAAYLRELRDEKLDVELERQRQKIEAERYVLTRETRDAARDEEIENLERDEYREKVRREIQFRLAANKLDLDDQLAAKADSVFRLARDRKEKNEDHDNQRTHDLAIIELDRKLQLNDRTHQLRLQTTQQDIELNDVEREARIRADYENQRAELQLLESDESARLARWTLAEDAQRNHLLKNAETQAQIDQIVRESKREKHKLQMEKASAALQLEREADANEQARSEADQELREKEKQADFERAEQSRVAAHQRSLDMDKTSNLTQLLTALNANPDNAVIAQTLAPLLQAEMTKGMSFQEILAQQGTNPEAAKTLRTYVRTQAPAVQPPEAESAQLQLVNRLLDQLESSNNASREQMQGFISELKELHLHDSTMFRDIAVANANSSAAANTPPTAAPADNTPSSEEMVEILKDIRKRLTDPNRDY